MRCVFDGTAKLSGWDPCVFFLVSLLSLIFFVIFPPGNLISSRRFPHLQAMSSSTGSLRNSWELEGRIRRAGFTKGQYVDELNYGLTVEEFEEKHAHKFS